MTLITYYRVAKQDKWIVLYKYRTMNSISDPCEKELNEPILFYNNFVIKPSEEFGKGDDMSPIKITPSQLMLENLQ